MPAGADATADTAAGAAIGTFAVEPTLDQSVTRSLRRLDPSEDDVILDPAMGTCGFLVTAMNYVLEKIGDSVDASGRVTSTALWRGRRNSSSCARSRTPPRCRR